MSVDGQKLSEDIVSQLELMYSGRGTKVHVSTSLANLYIEKKPSTNFPEINAAIDKHYNAQNSASNIVGNGDCSKTNVDHRGDPGGVPWQLVVTGVPVLVYDTGSSGCRTCKRLQLFVVNVQTGFLAFCQNLDESCQYKRSMDSFHTFSLKTNVEDGASAQQNGRKPAQVVAGLRFNRTESAQQFYKLVKSFEQEAVASADRETMKKQNCARKKKRGNFFGFGSCRMGGKTPFLRKTDISEPIWFKHVTSVKVADLDTIP